MLFQGAKVRGEDEREKWKLRTFIPSVSTVRFVQG
jgi:hypothetical protein